MHCIKASKACSKLCRPESNLIRAGSREFGLERAERPWSFAHLRSTAACGDYTGAYIPQIPGSTQGAKSRSGSDGGGGGGGVDAAADDDLIL